MKSTGITNSDGKMMFKFYYHMSHRKGRSAYVCNVRFLPNIYPPPKKNNNMFSFKSALRCKWPIEFCLRTGSGKTLVSENHPQVESCWIIFIQRLTLWLANRALFSNNLLISILFALALQKLSPFVPAFIFCLSESPEIKKKSITQLAISEGGSVFLAARLAYKGRR